MDMLGSRIPQENRMLKAIELIGFKSFADRTRLEFGDGITAIVGPNGSGKSNIVDAIKCFIICFDVIQ